MEQKLTGPVECSQSSYDWFPVLRCSANGQGLSVWESAVNGVF